MKFYSQSRKCSNHAKFLVKFLGQLVSFGTSTISITTLCIMTLSIKLCWVIWCWASFFLRLFILSLHTLGVVMQSFIMRNVITLTMVMLNVIILSVIMLIVLAPFLSWPSTNWNATKKLIVSLAEKNSETIFFFSKFLAKFWIWSVLLFLEKDIKVTLKMIKVQRKKNDEPQSQHSTRI